jgi:hypothetical protein
MKALILIVAIAAGFSEPAAAGSWGEPGLRFDVQAQKGRPDRGQQQPRDYRPDRRGGDERRERLNDDERRALHRDLDKANRELYKPRPR